MSTGPAVVVGGGSGIGASVAARYRAAQVDVVVWDVAGDSDIVCDITDPEQIDAATAATVALVGMPSVVTISAGVGQSGPLSEVDPAEWDRVMGVNAKGVWLTMRSLAGAMRPTGRGSIVAISSVSSQLADQTMGLYCASKAALDMIVKVAACEWAPAVRVNAVAPGVTDTPMLGRAPLDGAWLSGVARRTPMDRIGRPDDIAEAVVALHGMTWVTGAIVSCDGGLSLHSPIDPTGAGDPTQG